MYVMLSIFVRCYHLSWVHSHQIVSFVVAGHETTSGTLNYTLHALSKNQDLQTRLRTEINDFRHSTGREPDFDDFMNGRSLPLLDATIKEALRFYPAAPLTERIATRDDVLPLRHPILDTKSGKLMNELRIKKGQTIFLPVIAINRSNALYGDGEVFRPERWLAENESSLPDKSELVSAGWNGSLTFSAGARLCIGYRLALYEFKVLLTAMLQRFRFEDDGKTVLEFKHVGSLQPRVVGREDEGVMCPVRMAFMEPE